LYEFPKRCAKLTLPRKSLRGRATPLSSDSADADKSTIDPEIKCSDFIRELSLCNVATSFIINRLGMLGGITTAIRLQLVIAALILDCVANAAAIDTVIFEEIKTARQRPYRGGIR
jgi:hypothetical protein